MSPQYICIAGLVLMMMTSAIVLYIVVDLSGIISREDEQRQGHDREADKVQDQ